MKLFLFCSLLLANINLPNSIFDISFKNLDGANQSMSDFKGKKIIVSVLDATSMDRSQLKQFDSIQKANNNVQVIIVPSEDFAGTRNIKELKDLRDSLNLSISIAKPMKTKKREREKQESLFKWLTQVSENTHFDYDVEKEGQYFVISEKGTLYAVFNKETPVSVVERVINEPFNE